MKTIIRFLIVVSFCIPSRVLLGAELLNVEVVRMQEEKVLLLLDSKIVDTILVKREIEALEQMCFNHPDIYVSVMSRPISCLVQNDYENKSEKWRELIDELNNKILAKEPENYAVKGHLMGTITFCMTLNAKDVSTFIEVNRKKRIAKLLELWQNVFDSIEPDWDRNNPDILHDYSPPISYQDGFISGQSPDSIWADSPVIPDGTLQYGLYRFPNRLGRRLDRFDQLCRLRLD